MVGAAWAVVFAAFGDIVDCAVDGDEDGEIGVGAVVGFEVGVGVLLGSFLFITPKD
jgi:hypothetical protein